MKLKRLETTNKKPTDTYEAEGNTESAKQFEIVLGEDSDLIDNINGKVLQLRKFKEELERQRRELKLSHV